MAQQSPRRLELTVTADQAGEKIDTLLRRELRLSCLLYTSDAADD